VKCVYICTVPVCTPASGEVVANHCGQQLRHGCKTSG